MKSMRLPLVASVMGLFCAAPSFAGSATPDDPRHVAREVARDVLELTGSEKLLIDRPDRDRPRHPITLPLFGRPLTLGARYTLQTRYDEDKMLDFDYLDLDNKDIDGDGDENEIEDEARGQSPRDDQLRINHGLQVDLFYPVTPDIGLYTEWKLFRRDVVWARNADEPKEWIFERGESWLYLGNLFETPFGLQIGRQRYFDQREWWWEEDLDSIRLRFDVDRFHAEVAVAQELLPVELDHERVEPDQKKVLRIFGSAKWRVWRRHDISFFALHQIDDSSHQSLVVNEPDPTLLCVPEDEIPPNLPPEAVESFRSGCPDPPPTVGFEDDSDATLTWLGGSLAGRHRVKRWGKFQYWLQAAGVFGRERYTDYSGPTGSRSVGAIDKHDVSGWGLDLGGVWALDLAAKPYFTINYAIGSGDREMSRQHDTGFRQTGLQDNSERLQGVVSLGYYGELLDPELSNLQIVSLGLGFRFLRRSSLDFVYHHFRQIEPAPFLRDAGFNRDPNGLDRDIGQEWDVIVGIEEWERIELRLVGSIFRPGKAFRPESGELSFLTSLRIRLNF